MLADDSPGIVPMQPPQGVQDPPANSGGGWGGNGVVAVEPAEHEEVGDDELAGADRDCGGRSREAGAHGVDPAELAPAASAGGVPAPAE